MMIATVTVASRWLSGEPQNKAQEERHRHGQRKAGMLVAPQSHKRPSHHRPDSGTSQAGSGSAERGADVGLHHDQRADRGPISLRQMEEPGHVQRNQAGNRGFDGLPGVFRPG